VRIFSLVAGDKKGVYWGFFGLTSTLKLAGGSLVAKVLATLIQGMLASGPPAQKKSGALS
jgi:hypothetical protein